MSAAYLRGQSGAGMLPPLVVAHVVEVRCGWNPVTRMDVWRQHGEPYGVAEFASQVADEQRARGFVARVRPVVVG